MKWNKPAVFGGLGTAVAALLPLFFKDTTLDAMTQPTQITIGVAGCLIAFGAPILAFLAGRKKNDGSGT